MVDSVWGNEMKTFLLCALCAAAVLFFLGCARQEHIQADLILHHGQVVTVDQDFSIKEAIAVRDGKILGVGTDREILKLKGPQTEAIDVNGKMLLPGLMDSHVHPGSAAMTEFDHPVPTMECIADVLDYIRQRAAAVGEGKWVNVSQVFITRLKEQRYPTREEQIGRAHV